MQIQTFAPPGEEASAMISETATESSHFRDRSTPSVPYMVKEEQTSPTESDVSREITLEKRELDLLAIRNDEKAKFLERDMARLQATNMRLCQQQDWESRFNEAREDSECP